MSPNLEFDSSSGNIFIYILEALHSVIKTKNQKAHVQDVTLCVKTKQKSDIQICTK